MNVGMVKAKDRSSILEIMYHHRECGGCVGAVGWKFQTSQQPAAAAGMDLKSLTLDQLQEELSNRGLETSGTQADLILRLQTALDEEEFGIDDEDVQVDYIEEPTNGAHDEDYNDDNAEENGHDETTAVVTQESVNAAPSNGNVAEKKRNSAARRAASAAKLIMSYDKPIGSSPADLEYVSLKKNGPNRNVIAVEPRQITSQSSDNKRTRAGRFNVPDQLVRQLKKTPAPVELDPEEEEKKRLRALRFGITLPSSPVETSTEAPKVVQPPVRGRKRNTGGIIAAEGDEDADKKRARELRFQSTGLGSTDSVLQDLQEKKKRRLEKFASLRAEDLSTTGGESLTEINQQEAREARFSFAIDSDPVAQPEVTPGDLQTESNLPDDE